MVNNWERLKWIATTIKELRKKSYPLIRYGIRLIITSLGILPAGGFVIKLIIPKELLPKAVNFLGLELSYENIPFYTLIICIITFLIGCILIGFELKKTSNLARSTSRILITGMLGTTPRFPDEILSKSEIGKIREPVLLGISEENLNYVDEQIAFFNSERTIDIYKRFIFNNNSSKAYIGGLARIPFLVAYGTCLRSISVEIKYFDKFHRNGNWKLLNDINTNIEFKSYNVKDIQANQNGQIGIAVGFTNKIHLNQLPEYLRNNTIILEPNIETERNLISSQENLHAISLTIQKIIDELSNRINCKEIHLFLSVQTTLAIEIGRRYQEGIHKDWIIHNYTSGSYDWGIKLNSKTCTRYQIL